MNDMAYRISFNLVAASDNRIHIVIKDVKAPVCGCIPMQAHKVFGLKEIQRSTFCRKCLEKYHKRPEEEFAIIK